jgi:hypothetical protein
MTMAARGAGKERAGIEIERINLNCARIWSAWPVTSPRGKTCIGTKLLSEALKGGIEAKCDTKRLGFFEVELGHAWFYFHIADTLGRIYMVAALMG